MRGEAEDVELAVATARKAHGTWSKLTAHERSRHIYRLESLSTIFSPCRSCLFLVSDVHFAPFVA